MQSCSSCRFLKNQNTFNSSCNRCRYHSGNVTHLSKWKAKRENREESSMDKGHSE